MIGEDTIRPGGIRSMSNPGTFGDPDHYSKRFTGTSDNGGVHTNSGIPNQVFFLAIEGGANRTSGVAVAGVGSPNREQIEKVFYRAFTTMLPASANFATARAATIQSARDLYGAGSPAERAVSQAWSAVGVN
jgi:thermolysin